MDILLLGGTYFIGRMLCKMLSSLGFHVSMLNRGTSSSASGVELMIADRRKYQEIASVLTGRSFDVVIDLSGYSKEDVAGAITALAGRFSQYIFCSSIAVCRQPPSHWPITEDHLKCKSVRDGDYGYNKWMAEKHIFQQTSKVGFAPSVVRPVYVYGPHDYSGRLDYFFSKTLTGEPIVLSGDGENIIQFGYVSDLCMTIVTMIGNKNAYGQVFNVSGRELVTVNQLIDVIFSIVGKRTCINRNAGRLAIDGGVSNLTNMHRFADISKAERTLGIVPKTSLLDGLKKTHEWWRMNRRRK